MRAVFLRCWLSFLLLIATVPCFSQTTDNKSGARIEILSTDRLDFDKRITSAQRLIGQVRLKHENAFMRCDSAYLFEDQTLIAFGHVTIDQDTIHIAGDRLDYSAETRLATLSQNVKLTDPGMELTTEVLTYSVRDRVARYDSGATIISRRDNNTLISQHGAYQAQAHRFLFSRNVRVTNPERTITADTLHYTTTTGVAEFLGPTRIDQGSVVMLTERGSYDTRTQQGRFTRAGRIIDGAQELRGDSLHYDERKGVGKAWGHVLLLDTANDMVVRGAFGQHFRREDRSMITGKVELVMRMGTDSLFLHADSLFAHTEEGAGKRIKAHRGVRFFKSDMQGVCDTLTYADQDSLITLRGAPFLWSGTDQISGRSMAIALQNGKAHRLDVEQQAILANAVDSVFTDTALAYFDQVTGTRITGYFANDELVRVVAEGNSRTVYFAQEENKEGVKETTGMNRVDCSRIVVGLDSGKVQTVSFLTKPDATLYPIDQAPKDQMRMVGFVWNAAARPVDRWDIFREATTGNGLRP